MGIIIIPVHLSYYILFSLCPGNLTYCNGQHRTTDKAAETVTGIGNSPVKPVCLSVEFFRNLNRGDLYEKSHFTDSQIMSILKQAEAGTPVAELCREHGMSNARKICA